MVRNRARLAISLAGMIIYLSLAAGSAEEPAAVMIGIQNIAEAAQAVHTILTLVKDVASLTTSSVDTAYVDLSTRIQTQDLSVPSIQHMEQTHLALRHDADSLRTVLRETEFAADSLFSLLNTRANQNATPELRSSLLAEVQAKQQEFNSKLATAHAVADSVDASIQKYDDIVGYIQVTTAIQTIDQYIATIDDIISRERMLNEQIQVAITEGQGIIASVEPQEARRPE